MGTDMTPVEGIEPVDGWVMMWTEYDYGYDRYPTIWYEAHHPELGERILQTSAYLFHPTQGRFEWLIKNGDRRCIKASVSGHEYSIPWSDDDIDAAIESERERSS